MSRRWIVLLIIALIVLTPAGLVIFGVVKPGGSAVAPKKVSLLWWTLDNTQESLKDILTAYHKLHPYIGITIEQKNPETYEQDLKEAWAKNQGPDIFELPNNATSTFHDYMTPAPKVTRVATYGLRKLLVREDVQITYQTQAGLTPRQIRSEYADIVGKDVILANANGQEAVYGLPLAMDTLMLFYNHDLLNSAGVIEPPATWDDFVQQVPKLTLQTADNKIARPGAGLGLAKNVPHAFDILSLLMMQNGALMVDPTGQQITFGRGRDSGDNPGLVALEFYTDFAQINPPKQVLTWSTAQPSALELFSQGKLAYAFGYQHDRQQIAKDAPGLNFGIAPVPHIYENQLDNDATAPPGDQARKITYGNYQVESVSLKAGTHANEAWNLVQFASHGGVVRNYLERTGQVSALKSVLKNQINDANLGVPAQQALAARSWYHGTNQNKANEFFATMIEDVALRGESAARALGLTVDQIQATLLPAP